MGKGEEQDGKRREAGKGRREGKRKDRETLNKGKKEKIEAEKHIE